MLSWSWGRTGKDWDKPDTTSTDVTAHAAATTDADTDADATADAEGTNWNRQIVGWPFRCLTFDIELVDKATTFNFIYLNKKNTILINVQMKVEIYNRRMILILVSMWPVHDHFAPNTIYLRSVSFMMRQKNEIKFPMNYKSD